MSETTEFSKANLVERMQAGYQQLEAILAPLSEAQMTSPTVNGTWSIKDNLAHLTTWQNYVLAHVQGVLVNKEPPPFMPGLSNEDEINERVYQENKDRPLAEVLADFRASYQRILDTVQATSEEILKAPTPWSQSRNPLWFSIVGNTFEHYAEHSNTIKNWLAQTTH